MGLQSVSISSLHGIVEVLCGVEVYLLVFGLDHLVLRETISNTLPFDYLIVRNAPGRMALATLKKTRCAGFWLKQTTFGYTINTQ